MINPVGNNRPEDVVRPGTLEEATQAQQASPIKDEKKTPAIANVDSDKVELSALAQDVKSIRENLANQEKKRAELVESLRQKVENGSYQVNVAALSQKLYDAGVKG